MHEGCDAPLPRFSDFLFSSVPVCIRIFPILLYYIILPKTAKENPLIPPFSAYMRGFLFLRLSQYVVGNSSVDGDQVEAADADNCVDDAAQPGHVSEDQGDEVEAEESDQTPVDGSDDRNGECGVIQSFHVKKPPFSGFCIVFLSLPASL